MKIQPKSALSFQLGMFIILLFSALTNTLQGQSDDYGVPVFNSVSTGEKQVNNMLLISNYYTLSNNIENKLSSVFIASQPTLDQIQNAAVTLQSDFFILTRERNIIATITLMNAPKREFTIYILSQNKQITAPCDLVGDITENRANELVQKKYDTTAYIGEGQLHFNGQTFQIIKNSDIENAVLDVIKHEKLNMKRPSGTYVPSKEELKNYILSESAVGRPLDFFSEIKGHEYDGLQIKPGLFTTKQGVALYKWGRACFDIGVNTPADAVEIFSEYQGKPTSPRDQDYIKMGFYKEWEK